MMRDKLLVMLLTRTGNQTDVSGPVIQSMVNFLVSLRLCHCWLAFSAMQRVSWCNTDKKPVFRRR